MRSLIRAGRETPKLQRSKVQQSVLYLSFAHTVGELISHGVVSLKEMRFFANTKILNALGDMTDVFKEYLHRELVGFRHPAIHQMQDRSTKSSDGTFTLDPWVRSFGLTTECQK